jgi:hypothetical protein
MNFLELLPKAKLFAHIYNSLKESVLYYFGVLWRYSSEDTKKNHGNPQSAYIIGRQCFISG